MKRCDSDQTLIRLIEMLRERLDEINEPLDDSDNADFILGSKTAYVECLEMIQSVWAHIATEDLNENIEEQYPI